jgi:hypothetical protein
MEKDSKKLKEEKERKKRENREANMEVLKFFGEVAFFLLVLYLFLTANFY